MCRICGRMVKCIFDTMPSRTPSTRNPRIVSPAIKPSATYSQSRHVSSRNLIQTTFKVESTPTWPCPPSFLLPFRANLHQAATQYATSIAPDHQQAVSELPASMFQNTVQTSAILNTEPGTPPSAADTTSTPSKPLVLSKSLQQLLPALEAQRPHYINAYIHQNPYLLTAGDTLRLPFHLHGVNPGDILRFNRASILGSRDYTLKAGNHSSETTTQKRMKEPNYLDERLFECRIRVMGTDTQPMTFKEKTKRRNRKVKTVKSKHKYTVLKVIDVKVKSLEELKQENGLLILES